MAEQLHHDNTVFIKNKFPIIIICDQVNSPANIGSIFRTADSFGVSQIYFCGTDISVESKRMQRTARATHEIIPYQQKENIISVIDTLISQGYIVFGLEITKNSVPISEYNFDPDSKIALIIGEEKNGISEEVLTKITQTVHINMYGINSSMNVATATGIALYEITKQLAARGD
ncbi:RNA methyltransferase [Aquimarina addita]|uniref:RNA methyltransferase n=1 Tax=Aquimarina addita TaxID=870485 RepID=A0ABP6UHJ2_9FLAO